MKYWIIPIIFVLFLYGCSSSEEKSESNDNKHVNETMHNHLSGDLQEVTSSVDILPQFLNSKSETIRLVYEASGKATEILQWIPCYCGCGESAGHKNNLECFIAEIREDGSAVWDDHGTRCDVCIEIAAKSISLYQQGKSIKEIRKIIDETYKEGYAKPTPTDMPAK